MDIVIEIILEIYMELMGLIVPEKNATKGMKVLAVIIAIIGAFGLPILFFIGLNMFIEQTSPWGLLLMILAAILILAQIIVGIVLYKKHH